MDKFFSRGRMMNLEKRHRPGHIEVYNANIFTRESGKIWFGDLDLVDDAKELKALAARVGHELYVLRERDGRFDHENNPGIRQQRPPERNESGGRGITT
jgi:hypothetical protein